jgi:hypothetical protein
MAKSKSGIKSEKLRLIKRVKKCVTEFLDGVKK